MPKSGGEGKSQNNQKVKVVKEEVEKEMKGGRAGHPKTKMQSKTKIYNQKKVKQVKERKGQKANIKWEAGKGHNKDSIRKKTVYQ